jgi:predicted aminopeptidase
VDINSIPRRLCAALLALVITVPVAGCYEMQAAGGQMSLLWKRRPIASVIADPATSAALRAQLTEVAEIRDFASRKLGLPDNGSYRGYSDIGRSDVVLNVFAAPEFSVEPKRWCYPVVGCVAYRGYFDERTARQFAAKLGAQGLDVAVQGATAYSTLGTFDDPVLSSMLGWGDVDLAAIIFHELTHQLLYVRDDASFNEALATLVEEEGVKRWLHAHGRDHDLEGYLARQARYRQVIGIMLDGRHALQSVYASGRDRATMLTEKSAVFDRMRRRYHELSAAWEEKKGYDSWFDGTLNNANLVSIATYQSCLPGLRRELAAQNGDLPGFYRRARLLAKLPAAERDRQICGQPEG